MRGGYKKVNIVNYSLLQVHIIYTMSYKPYKLLHIYRAPVQTVLVHQSHSRWAFRI